jgi:[acyl-carrier-protein] S-malonyltransferase
MRLAFLFPGQGAQTVGMGQELAQSSAAARAVFEAADRVLGFSLRDVCWNGPAETLTQTVFTQPALVATSLAGVAALAEAGIKPEVVAGHSIGEYAALAAAGVLSPEEAIRLAHERGRLMEDACQVRPGTMAAVLNFPHDKLETVCAQASAAGVGTVVVANFNTADQIVISGDVAAIDKAVELLTAQGVRKVQRLTVGGAFHSPLMEPARAGLGEALDAVEFKTGRIPVLSTTTLEETPDGTRLRSMLKQQVVSQVRFEPAMRHLATGGLTVIEVGPGKALSGMLRRIAPDVQCLRVSDVATLQQTVAAIRPVATVKE